MALKRRHKIEAGFSMASMTDVIFLLLIFFMITSTIVFPNSIKVNLPEGGAQEPNEAIITQVTIKEGPIYYIAFGKEEPQMISEEELSQLLATVVPQKPEEEQFIALYADENIPYREVVKVLSLASENNLKMVLATRQPQTP